MAKVYLVEDCCNNPGRIYAVFKDRHDAEDFASWFDGEVIVVERTLFYGQPPRRGVNE